MRRVLGFIALAIGSYASMAWGALQEHPFILYAGMTVAGMLALGMVVWLLRLTARFMGWAMTSVLYLGGALAVIGLLSYHEVIPAIAGFGAGAFLSACLLLVFMRRLARWGMKSLIGGEVFSFASGYQIKSYIGRDTIIEKDTAITLNVDFKNIVLVLKELGYDGEERKQAAIYALEHSPANEPIEDKIKTALSYFANKEELAVRQN